MNRPPDLRRRWIAPALFAFWAAVVVAAALRHVPWRDEVRAYSRALAGASVFAMLGGIHGEGHPALWYLLLRGVHTLLPQPQALPLTALLVAAAAALLLLFESPFSWPLKALILAGNAMLFEYAVMARNYGITWLLLFLLAALYERHRERGILAGVLLFLLANTNVHSLVLVAGFLVFWFLDLKRVSWPNAALAVAGAALAILTVYPPVSDSAVLARPSAALLLRALILPGEAFRHLTPIAMNPFLLSALLFGSTLGLVRFPGLLLSAVATLCGLSAVFAAVYPGLYRHEALWLGFLIACYWIALRRSDGRRRTPLSIVGWSLFLLLLALQVPIGVASVAGAMGNSPPLSGSRALATLIDRHPDLRNAVILAEPDYLVESLPYYLPNRTFLLREQRFGNIVIWTHRARLQLSLGDVLAGAQAVERETGQPVLILLAHRPDPSLPARTDREAYNWEFSTTPDQAREFLSATALVGTSGPSLMGETFSIYRLN